MYGQAEPERRSLRMNQRAEKFEQEQVARGWVELAAQGLESLAVAITVSFILVGTAGSCDMPSGTGAA
jgi:hypothetical protein